MLPFHFWGMLSSGEMTMRKQVLEKLSTSAGWACQWDTSAWRDAKLNRYRDHLRPDVDSYSEPNAIAKILSGDPVYYSKKRKHPSMTG